jgi:hypothetical protein
MQILVLLLFGILIGAVLLAAGVLLYQLLRQMMATVERVREAIAALEKAARVFERSADMNASMIALVGVMRRSISSMESVSASIKVFTGLVLKDEGPPEPPPQEPFSSWRPGGPPPPNPLYDSNASPDDAGYMEQTDEDLAEIERQNELREQGIETDPLRIQMPRADQINMGSV